ARWTFVLEANGITSCASPTATSSRWTSCSCWWKSRTSWPGSRQPATTPAPLGISPLLSPSKSCPVTKPRGSWSHASSRPKTGILPWLPAFASRSKPATSAWLNTSKPTTAKDESPHDDFHVHHERRQLRAYVGKPRRDTGQSRHPRLTTKHRSGACPPRSGYVRPRTAGADGLSLCH